MGILIAFILLPVCVMTGAGYLIAFPAIYLGLWLIVEIGTRLEKLAHSAGTALEDLVHWIDATIDGWLDSKHKREV